MVKARIEKDINGVHRIIVQRAKFKHWFELGTHKATTNMFYKKFGLNEIAWEKEIASTDTLFNK